MHSTSHLGHVGKGKASSARSLSPSSSPTSSPSVMLFSSDSSGSSMSPAEQQLPILGKRKQRASGSQSVQTSHIKQTQEPDAVPPRLTAIQRSVPAFLNKLYNMIEDSSTSDFIHWSDDGASFIVENHEEFAKTVLPRFYKHNTFASFVRQLNMYDFHKVPHPQQSVLIAETEDHDRWEFSNPYFRRDRTDLLLLVTRKRSRDRDQEGSISANEKASRQLETLAKDMAVTRKSQISLRDDLRNLHRDNEMLWKETISVRERHQRHQEAIEKILQFLNKIYSGDRAQIPANEGIEHSDPRELLTEAASLAGMQINADQGLAPNLLQLTDKPPLPQDPVWATPMDTDSGSGGDGHNGQNTTIASFSRTLDTATRSAQAISQDIDDLQLNIESLASNLGIDPRQYENEQLSMEDDYLFTQPVCYDYMNSKAATNGEDDVRRASIAHLNQESSSILASRMAEATFTMNTTAVPALADVFPSTMPPKDLSLPLIHPPDGFVPNSSMAPATNGAPSSVATVAVAAAAAAAAVATTTATEDVVSAQAMPSAFPVLQPPPLAARRAMLAPGRVPSPVLISCIKSSLWQGEHSEVPAAPVVDLPVNPAINAPPSMVMKLDENPGQLLDDPFAEPATMSWKQM